MGGGGWKLNIVSVIVPLVLVILLAIGIGFWV
jgi:hypothetical protein